MSAYNENKDVVTITNDIEELRTIYLLLLNIAEEPANTNKKLGVNLYKYLHDRINGTMNPFHHWRMWFYLNA